ncbi:MAG TPA: hypothetical protein VEI03_14145 [Stellaceae bacterium]|nr:hypothetical protein [Stellaceae bacterium]
MSFRSATSLGALIGMVLAFIIFALVSAIDAGKTSFPEPYAHLIASFRYFAPFMFWPAGSDFLDRVSYEDIPVGSLRYLGLLLYAVL